MKKILYLVTPELGLIFNVFFVRKILDQQYRLIGDVGLFNTEFKEFFFRRIGPVKTDIFFYFAFHHLSLGGGSVPGETENIIALIHLIGKPFLKPGRGTQKLV